MWMISVNTVKLVFVFVLDHCRKVFVFVFVLDQYNYLMYLIQVQLQVKHTFCMALQARKIVVAKLHNTT